MSKKLKLGYANIGDLLLSNTITQLHDEDMPTNINLRIPEYQRPYKWTAKNANQLLDDIEEAMNSNKEVYRAGTLILHHDEKRESYNIVDGQQRTITFSILLKCLLNEDEDINFLNQQVSYNSFNIRNVKKNYMALKRRVEKMNERKNELKNYIIERCELIIVITDDLSEAFQFFDSQNARGKSLYPHDLLKAYHLREMNNLDVAETEKIVKMWEEIDQKKLALMFNEYLYRLKEWLKGNKATELTEQNIEVFKGVTSRDNHPFAQYCKGAYAYINDLNNSCVPFVTGIQQLIPFQLNAPIVAGKPFFEYAKHYFDILSDIQNNDKYEGYFINDNEIVKTLDLRKYRNGVGNRITRLMMDTAILLYVDRFCPEIPSVLDIKLLDQFVVYVFVWAYSMRAQYTNVGWYVAQNYIMGTSKKEDIRNSFNIYKMIVELDSPGMLLSRLADNIVPLSYDVIKADISDYNVMENGIYQNYLYYFEKHDFLEGRTYE